MRVALVVPGALDQPTGGYVYDAIVARGLAARGHDVRVVSLAGDNPRALAEGVRDARADVTIVDELAHDAISGALGELPAPWVLLAHHLRAWEQASDDARHARELACVRAATSVVATSRTTAARLVAESGRGDVRAIVPGGDRLPREASAPAADHLRLLFVGTWTPRKRLGALLDAVEPLAARGTATLAIAGDPSRDPAHAAALRGRIEASPALRAAVRALGVLDEPALARAYASADLLVLPSSLEGYGMVLAEAVHAGLGVVASRVGAIPEAVRDGAEARLFELGDASALAALLARLAANRGEVDAMRAAAAVRGVPSWHDATAAWHELITALAASPRGAPSPRPAPAR